MAKLTGSIDERGRPLVRVSVVSGQDDVLATVDTGFNGELMMGKIAARQLNVVLNDVIVHVELGNGMTVRVNNGLRSIHWMDRVHVARVLVSNDWPAPKPDAPVALLGTALLAPHLLLVDFDAGTVEIETTA